MAPAGNPGKVVPVIDILLAVVAGSGTGPGAKDR
jgi:hypothetical protein